MYIPQYITVYHTEFSIFDESPTKNDRTAAIQSKRSTQLFSAVFYDSVPVFSVWFEKNSSCKASKPHLLIDNTMERRAWIWHAIQLRSDVQCMKHKTVCGACLYRSSFFSGMYASCVYSFRNSIRFPFFPLRQKKHIAWWAIGNNTIYARRERVRAQMAVCV